MPDKICKQCNRPIQRRWAHELAVAVFCSSDCKIAYQKINPTRPRVDRAKSTCRQCGLVFSYLASIQPGIYCSVACKRAGHSKTMTGRQYVDNQEMSDVGFRIRARKVLGDECSVCGWSEASVDVCHIKARSDGGENTFENVVLLCPNHHRMLDQGKLSIDKQEATHVG